jgi:TRAP-type transport system periplasmic protein
MKHQPSYTTLHKALKKVPASTRLLLLLGLALLLLAMATSCRQQGAPKLIKIGLTHGQSHSFTQALERFGRQLEEETGGRYRVKVFYGSQIGSEKEMQEMLTVGSLEMTVTGLLNTYEPLFAVLELPYLYDDRQHVMRVMESPVVEEMSGSLHGQGLQLFGFFENGYRHITNSVKAIHAPGDLAGMMIRVPENPAQIQTFKALGAIPTPLSFSELYTALVQGVVDGQENPLQNIWFGRLYEAQKHLAMTGHIYNSAYVLIGRQFYTALPEEDKAIFARCMHSAIQWQLQHMIASDRGLEEQLKEKGVQFTYPDVAPFREASLPAYQALYASLGERARGIVDSIQALSASRQPPTHKVLYINSYHQGYAPSDEMMLGIEEGLKGKGVALETYFMDTKRNGSPEHAQKVVRELLLKIGEFQPDLLLVSDDNAVKELVVPHFREGPLPVLFCGVNWSAEEYGLPTPHVSGMLEVLPLPELMDTLLAYYPGARKLTILSENTLSEEKNKLLLDTLFRSRGLQPDYRLVNTFAEWKEAFKQANQTADLIYLPTNGAIKGWNDQEAVAFIEAHLARPVVSCDAFMMQFSVLGFTKRAREQGDWTAARALEVLQGREVAGIPLARNKEYDIWYNEKLALLLGFTPGQALKQVSKKYQQSNQLSK